MKCLMLDEKKVIELLIGLGPKQQANLKRASSNNNTINSSNAGTENEQHATNTAAYNQLGIDNITHGKKNKKKKTPNNNNGEEVQRPQGNKTVGEQSQETEEYLSTNDFNGYSDERKKITIIFNA
eukprot:Seg7982.1 transcript_id=Seg7982.1/GoldUCD/mRNA.D3Y31 product="hypothetical protein" protein_id=Seg7982.1/GoldUCD/D3Y31